MLLAAPPDTAAWYHKDARTGFEVVFFHLLDDGHRVHDRTTALEDGQTWTVDYTNHRGPNLDQAEHSKASERYQRSLAGEAW